MRTITKLTLLLMAFVLGTTTTMARDKRIELEAQMFKAWSSPAKDAVPDENNNVRPDGDNEIEIGCEFNLYKQLDQGNVVYGNTNVYYLWYADITGTKTIYAEGTPGLALRVLMNRPEPVEGGDTHGGTTTERRLEIGQDGKGSLDVSDLDFVHLNCIKIAWGANGTVKKLEIEGSVKNTIGWVDMVDNSDMEEADVKNFVVALDAVNDPNTYPATIVDGAGVDGSRAVVVESKDSPEQTWATQFFVKLNEFLPEGEEWRMSFDARCDNTANVTSGAHGEPRAWQAGGIIEQFELTPEWQHFEFSGKVTKDQAGAAGLGSVAFDLNNLGTSAKYTFDNVVFEVNRGINPLTMINAGFYEDIICVDFGAPTNIQQLVGSKKRIIFPSNCVTVKVNGEDATVQAVEAKPDGFLWIFLEDQYPTEEDAVEFSFTNPAAAEYHLTYTDGKYEGQDVFSFTDVSANFNEDLNGNFSYKYDIPVLESADPENGSFNLKGEKQDFTVVFDNLVNAAEMKATLGGKEMTVNPVEGQDIDGVTFARQFTLTRTDNGVLKGEYILSITNIQPECYIEDFGTGSVTLTLNFGKVEYDPNDLPEDILPVAYFENAANNSVPEGFKVIADNEEERNASGSYGSGARVFSFAEGGDFVKGLYYRNNYVSYGEYDDHALEMEAGKKYTIHFNTARWKSSGQWTKFQVMNEFDEAELEEIVENNPDTNGQTGSPVKGSTVFEKEFIPEMGGRYILKWICASNANGDQGTYNENLLANVWVRYVPNAVGITETLALQDAIAAAKAVRDANAADRYAGADFTALDEAIAKYEAEGPDYTAPSAYTKAVEVLNALAEAMKDHRLLCDTYDPLPQKGQDILDQNAGNKFAKTEWYAELKGIVAKYGTKQMVTKVNEEDQSTYEVEELVIKQLTDNAELQAAIDELNNSINFCSHMFTTGVSKRNTTGVAALTDRLRIGLADLKALNGLDETNNWLAGAVENAMEDDDALAEELKSYVKTALYKNITSDPEFFNIKYVIEEDFETGAKDTTETIVPAYDMTVFVKNPNIYAPANSTKVPGWETIKGNAFGWSSWDGAQNHSDSTPWAEDGCIHTGWHASATAEQTIVDLPVGIYNINFQANDNSGESDGTYVYAKLSTTPAVEDGADVDMDVNFAGWCQVDNAGWSRDINGITVTDGQLTLGFTSGTVSQPFLESVSLAIVNVAEGVNYSTLLQEALSGVEIVDNTKTVRRVEMFDLNGRRAIAGKGLFIVRKTMDDGTTVTEKVIRK